MSTDAGAADTTVTKIVDRIPHPGMEARLEAAIHDVTSAALRFPGHLGVTVTRPAPPAQPGFRLVYKFDTCGHLRAWEESAEHHRVVRNANRYTQGEARYQTLTGLEAWISLPATAAATNPPRGKLTIVSWLGIFPLVYLYAELIGRILPESTPFVVRIFLVSVLTVPTMSYVVGPRLTRWFSRWLYPVEARP
jgi:antibiotic biosynthesis monooxygenase (ABM) superfamily enzyme